jgi:hypothetical protein
VIADLMIAGTDFKQAAIRRSRQEPIGNGETAAGLARPGWPLGQLDSNPVGGPKKN